MLACWRADALTRWPRHRSHPEVLALIHNAGDDFRCVVVNEGIYRAAIEQGRSPVAKLMSKVSKFKSPIGRCA